MANLAILVTSDTIANSVQLLRMKNWIGRTSLVNNKPEHKRFILFLRMNPTILSRVAQNLTADNFIMEEISRMAVVTSNIRDGLVKKVVRCELS